LDISKHPIDEAKRLISLHSSRLLDSGAEERFDRITRLAAEFFSVQSCLFSLVDSDRQWFKSRVGFDFVESRRDISFCSHAILGDEILVVNDATKDERFASSPLVTMNPNIRFYAGAPVRDLEGLALGTLCIIDPLPRQFSTGHEKALRDFADMIEHEIASADQAQFESQLMSNLARTSSIISTLPDMVFVIDREFRFLVCNEHPDLLKPRHQVLGRTIEEVIPGDLAGELMGKVEQAFNAGGEITYHEYFLGDTKKTFEARYKKIDHREVLVIVRDTTEQTLINDEIERLSEVARQTTNGVMITDEHGHVVWINNALTDMTGYNMDEMAGRRPGDVLQGEGTDESTVSFMRNALMNHEGFNVDVVNYSKAGAPYWVRIACNPMRDKSGRVKGYIAIETDITRAKQNDERIRNSDKLLKAVIDANAIGTWQFNIQTGELQINDKWAALIGYELNELIPTNRATWEKLTHPEDLAYCSRQLEKHTIGLASVYEANMRMKHKKGHWVWINTRGRISTRTSDGRAEWLLGTHFDVTAQIAAETTLQHQSIQMRAIVENMLDGVIGTDGKGAVITFNRAAEQIFGFNSSEILGRNINVLIPSPHTAGQTDYLAYFFKTEKGDATGRRVRELEGVRKDGSVFSMELGVVEIEQSGDINFIGIVRDISERKEREREINQLAFYDALTKLPNRRLLLDRLQHVIANCERHNHYAALFFLDLDKFKNLNDSAGHGVGDVLLHRVGKRLANLVRQSDTVARLGGDEFVVLVDSLGVDEQMAALSAKALAEKIGTDFHRSFDLNGLTYNCSVSIGITLFNDGSLQHLDLLKRADLAMYQSKGTGRNRICFYDPKMQVVVDRRMEIEQDLHRAIHDRQFELHYQKQVDQDGQLIGAEVLLRWQHPEKGLISPAEFIPSAEETGLIVPLGKWVLVEACRTLAKWSEDPERVGITIAVNISVAQFSEQDFVKTITETLKASGADPKKLKLEITESLLASNAPDIRAKMFELQCLGVSFSIDDFGTGYSSLAYLKELPIDQLKIDQSFVRDILNNPNDRAIAQAVITLAESMWLSVIAEGVESEEQRNLLLEMGCKAYQGYLFGRPCNLEDFSFV
jgi:diguanylate cyclase (GGDEF)-like protein/PAS domain S-box-containing protein